MKTIHTKIYSYQGLQIKYHEMGEGETLFLLHGVGSTAKSYLKCMKVLSSRYHIIAPDIPGFGGSDTPKAIWGFKEYATCFNNMISDLRVAKFSVVGHSFGGGIALNMVAQNSYIHKLVLADSSGIGIKNSKLKTHYHFFIRKSLYNLLVNRSSVNFILLKSFTKNVLKNLLHFRHLMSIINNCTYKDHAPLDKIKVPTLVLWGSRDEVYTLGYAQKFHKGIVGSRLEIVPGNHDWLLFKPERLLEKLESFI